MKTLNFEQMQVMTDLPVTKATITIIDRRTGEMEDRDFYRPAQSFPIDQICVELKRYGYDVLGYKEELVEGRVNWKNAFEAFTARLEKAVAA